MYVTPCVGRSVYARKPLQKKLMFLCRWWGGSQVAGIYSVQLAVIATSCLPISKRGFQIFVSVLRGVWIDKKRMCLAKC